MASLNSIFSGFVTKNKTPEKKMDRVINTAAAASSNDAIRNIGLSSMFEEILNETGEPITKEARKALKEDFDNFYTLMFDKSSLSSLSDAELQAMHSGMFNTGSGSSTLGDMMMSRLSKDFDREIFINEMSSMPEYIGMRTVMQNIHDGTATVQQLKAFANASDIDIKGVTKKDDILQRIEEAVGGLEADEAKTRRNPKIKKILQQQQTSNDMDDNIAASIGDDRTMTKEEYKKLRREARKQRGTIEEQNQRIENEKKGKARTQAKRLSKEHEEALLINSHIDDPGSITKLNLAERRTALNEAFVSGGDKFVKNTADQAIMDKNLLYKLDADDNFIKEVYTKVNSDDFILDTAKSKWESGKFKNYSSFGKPGDVKWDDLTDAQRASLIDDVRNNELRSFNSAFEGERKKGWGPFKKTEPSGEMDLKAGRQRFIREELGFDPSKKAYKKQVKRLSKLDDNGKALNAYKAYHSQAIGVYNSGTSTALPSAKEFLSKEGFDDDTIKTVMKGLGNDGIKAGSKLKGLKVAGAIAGGVAALWAMSEIYDE